MLTISSVFVDMSRIQLANAMAESAGDLTLNTALTNYDAELKNLYGLFATAQDMDELMANLEDYYRDSIMAAGVDSAAADDYVGQVMDYLRTTTGVDDLMKIELTGFEVSVPAGGNLGNPAILKSQLVEFMKYRAPISLGTGFLEALSTMKDLSKQTAMVENKNKFYEQHQDMLGTLEDAWWQIQLYQYADATANTGFPTGSYLTDEGSLMAENAKRWKDDNILENAVKYLYRSRDFDSLEGQYWIRLQYLCPECEKANNENKSSCGDCGTALVKEKKYEQWVLTWQGSTSPVKREYTEDDPANIDDVITWLNTSLQNEAALEAYMASTFDIESRGKGLGFSMANHKETDTSDADKVNRVFAVCIANEELDKGTNYLKMVKNLLESLVSLNAAVNTCDEELLNSTMVTYIESEKRVEQSSSGASLKTFADGALGKLSLDATQPFGKFNATVTQLKSNYNAASSVVNSARTDGGTAVHEIRDQAYNYNKKLEEKIGNLAEAIRLLGLVQSELSNPSSAYNTALKNWKSSADAMPGNPMSDNDLSEMKNLQDVLTLDRVNALITRLTNAKTTLEDIQNQVALFTVSGKAVKDIKANANILDFVDWRTKWKSDLDKVNPINGGSYSSVITAFEGSVTTGEIKDTWGESEKSPDLTDQQRELYTWMYNNFYKEVSDYSTYQNQEQTTAADTDVGNLEKDLESKATGQNCTAEQTATTKVNRDMSQYLNKELKALPSTRWGDEQAAIAEGKIDTNADNMLAQSNQKGDNVLTTLLSLASDMGAELRDNLYVTEYIMSMFSYDTIEAEVYVEKKGNSTGYKPFYTANGDTYEVTEGCAEYAELLKTVTNNSINPNMNYMYGKEVEYILYGKNGTESVYGTIFLIRFALNTVYAFTDAEINNVTLSAATALFGTPPLTPLIPFAKAAMTVGLAVAETAWDLVQLRKGEAIPLMKNKQTWIMSPSGITKEAKAVLTDTAKEAAYKLVDAGYKVLNDAIEMSSEELQKLIDKNGEEFKNLADAAVATVTSQVKNEANQALQKVVELCNAVNQKMMVEDPKFHENGGLGATDEKVNMVMNELQAWMDQQPTDNPAIREAKQIAVDYLKNSTVVADVFNTISAQSDPAAAANDLLTKKLDEIEGVISTKIDALASDGVSAVSQMKNDLENKLKNAAKEGADKLKETLSNEIGNVIGSVPEKGGKEKVAEPHLMASLLAWTYSDYLRVFVLVGMFANEELMLLRTADVIEINMQKKNNEYAVITTTETVTTSRFFGLWKTTEEKQVSAVNKDAFSLSKAYTYISVDATLQVKPLLMTMPFMAETVENQLTGTNWYEISYSGTLGY